MDPPLRSRFQSHLVSLPDYQDFIKYLSSSSPRVNTELINNLCNFGYSFYTSESNSLNLPDFPVENLDKLTRIMNKINLVDSNESNHLYSEKFLDTSKLIEKIYPFSLILKDEETNGKFCNELMEKFNLPKANISVKNKNDLFYEFIEVESKSDSTKEIKFKSLHKPENVYSIDMIRGHANTARQADSNFIMNKYHSSQIVDLMLSHAAEHDFCLIGPQGLLF